MADALTRLEAARTKIETAKAARIRAEASLEQIEVRRGDILSSLEALGVESTAEAKAKITELEAELANLLDEIERKLP